MIKDDIWEWIRRGVPFQFGFLYPCYHSKETRKSVTFIKPSGHKKRVSKTLFDEYSKINTNDVPEFCEVFSPEKLKKIRKNQGMTLRDLSKRTKDIGRKVDPTALCRYENGSRVPGVEHAKVIISALQCSLADLFEHKPQKKER